MSNIYKLIILSTLLIFGCKSKVIEQSGIVQKIDNLDLIIYSKDGNKIYSIKSPNSSYDRLSNTLNLNKTTINLFKKKKIKYIITSDKSKLSNNQKILELIGNVEIKNKEYDNEILKADNFFWNINDSNYMLKGNVKFENTNIVLTSNKALMKDKNIIEFFNPVKYINKVNYNDRKYEIKAENAFYNVKTKSLNFSADDTRVRSKIYF